MTEQELSQEDIADLMAEFLKGLSGSEVPAESTKKRKPLNSRPDWTAVTWSMLKERGVNVQDIVAGMHMASAPPVIWVHPDSLFSQLPRLLEEAGGAPEEAEPNQPNELRLRIMTQSIEDFPSEVLEGFYRDEVIDYFREDPDARHFMESMARLRYPPPSEE